MVSFTTVKDSFYVRHQRRIRRVRALRKQRNLYAIRDRSTQCSEQDLFLFAVVHNEKLRLPFFIQYYRNLGINHFFFIDNDSDDGTCEYLAAQPDVSLWGSAASYKRAHFGMDWVNALMRRFARGHWALVVDVDEFFVYPYCDTRPLRALTDWLDSSAVKSFGALLLDMYPEGPIFQEKYSAGQDPFTLLNYFDAGNYSVKTDRRYGNVWIQGGPRQRVFFADNPAQAPALNKIPLIKWQRGNVYISSTHTLLPRGLNNTYEEWGGEKLCGALLHAKLLPDLKDKTERELLRKQHYAGSREYRAYNQNETPDIVLHHPHSTRFKDWRQLEELGLISLGGWA